MAKYRPLLSRMISRLDANTPEARQSVYASVRTAFIALMGPQDASQTSAEKYDRDHRALEDAIATVEASMLDGEETLNASSVSSEKGERSYSPMNVPTVEKQSLKDTPSSSTISTIPGMMLDTPGLSSENYYRAWQLLRQSWQSLPMR
jgi:hypothetical protein